MRMPLLWALAVVCLVLAAPAGAGTIKWHQPPDMDDGRDYDSWFISDVAGYQVADDYLCRDGRPVTDVHWWGSYIPGTQGKVEKFMVQFWSDVPAGPDGGFSHPGERLYQKTIANVPEAFYGWTAAGEAVFEYNVSLGSTPFPQERGKIYWLSIRAVLTATGDQKWGWHESRVRYNDWAVQRFGGGSWYPIWGQWEHGVDMAFYLTTEGPDNGVKWSQGPDMQTGVDTWSQIGVFSSQVADDFPCKDGVPIAALRWWGSFPGPTGSEIPPGKFIIRFFSDVPATVDPPYSHPGDLLYEETVDKFVSAYAFTTPDGEDVFEYFAQLPKPFDQREGKVYWLSIVAVLDLPGLWGWHEASQHYLDAAVMRCEPKWWPIVDPTGRQVDMSFVLITTAGAKWTLPPATDHAGDWVSQLSSAVPWYSEVADDFICEEGSPISDVHWWGSYYLNMRGPLRGFWIRFYDDIPWSPSSGYSRPGKLLKEFYVREYNETFYGVSGTGENVYQYYALLPEWFRQEMGKVYWISIQADGDVPPLWGWHDSRFHWNDDAAGRELVAGSTTWRELYNDVLDVSTDMAFELTSPLVTTPPRDYFSPLWVWFSIPLIPVGSNEVSDVLGFNATNCVYRWDPIAKTTELYPYDFTTLETARGYMLYTQQYRAPQYEGVIPPKTVYLPKRGITWIGLPGVEDYFQGWALVENLTTGEIRSAAADFTSASPWVNWNFVYWNTYLETAEICIFNGSGDDTYMHPWYGYLVWSWADNLRLILNRPYP
jgi:hypothetical protein